jgi:NADH-quinone oxidoreductase subunit F
MAAEKRLILKHLAAPDYTPDLACYERHGGYAVWRRVLAEAREAGPALPERLRREVMVSGLRGRGGAGFSCGLKWSLVDRQSGKPIYLIANADEAEPGTFKDRLILHRDPHQLLEGMILSAFANDVHQAYLYLRGEFMEGYRLLTRALAEVREANLLGPNILGSGYDLEIHLHRGAGAYICGEETGLLESLEGRRPHPRLKPPHYPAVRGLYQCPTIVNNVETLCAVKHVLEMGGAEYAKLGRPDNTGTRLVCLSGRVNRPGCYEIEVGGATLRELIFDEAFGGGLPDGRPLQAVIPGGVSSKVLRADEKVTLPEDDALGELKGARVSVLDLPYDFTTLAAAGSMSGSGGIIVLDDTVDPVEALANISEFFAHESCGQCTPCREGSLWMARVLRRLARGRGRAEDADLLLHIAGQIPDGRAVCAFGEACAWPVQSFVSKFKDAFTPPDATEDEDAA